MARIGGSVCLVLLAAASASAAIDFDIPRYDPPDENAFDHYQRAFALLAGDRPWDELSEQLDATPLEDAEVALLMAQEGLDELRAGIGKPCVMPPMEAADTPLPYLRDFRSAARLLALEGWVCARRGDFSASVASYRDGLVLGQDAARNGVLIHKLVSAACEAIVCRAIRRTVGICTEEAALVELTGHLAAFEGHEVLFGETLALEYDCTRRALENSRNDPQAAAGLADIAGAALPPGTVDQALADLDAVYSRLVAASRNDYWALSPADLDLRANTPLIAALAPQVRKAQSRCVAHTAMLRGTLLVAALGLYFARHGGHPATLADLVPDTLKQLPIDPFSGQGFRYVLDDPLTYRVYSVGPNMRDDGGVEPQNRAGDDGDLVFSTTR